MYHKYAIKYIFCKILELLLYVKLKFRENALNKEKSRAFSQKDIEIHEICNIMAVETKYCDIIYACHHPGIIEIEYDWQFRNSNSFSSAILTKLKEISFSI